jgi:transcriptional regulator with XRE-family HTH domain
MRRLPPDSLGYRLQEERIKQGLLQREVASLLNISTPAVTAYERNKSQPSLKTLAAYARLFNVTVHYLVQGSEITRPQEVRTPTELRVLNVFRRAPEEKHEGMIAVLKVTAKLPIGARR